MKNAMLQQVHSLPGLIQEALPSLDGAVRTALDPVLARSLERVFLVGCGDSHHASLAAELAFESLAGLPAEPMTALQFSRYAAPHLPAKKALVVGISVSGEVARTVEALQMARRAGGDTLALTANPESRVGRAAAAVLPVRLPAFPVPAGMVIPGVRTFAGNLIALSLLAVHLGEARGALSGEQGETARRELLGLAEAAERTLAACDLAARSLAEGWAGSQEFVFLGAGPNYGTALYSAAKVLEASGDSALGQDTEEWAHLQYFGRAAATPTLVISAGGRDVSRAMEVAVAARAIGRRVVAVAPEWASGLHAAAGQGLPLGLEERATTGEAFSPLVAAIPGALLAAHRASLLDEPFFRDFGGGRSVQGGGGISRIQTSEILEGL